MPNVSIALIKQSNSKLASKKAVTARSSKLSKANINDLMKEAYGRLSR
ncbi:hypothetical protein RTH46_20655 [Pseudomonas sp. zfem004]|nr:MULTISPECIES: hypothetical protein [unclassified Pseudomonas]MDU9404901.1 hypothetical protein [Pseudomonas sp. zfem004]